MASGREPEGLVGGSDEVSPRFLIKDCGRVCREEEHALPKVSFQFRASDSGRVCREEEQALPGLVF